MSIRGLFPIDQWDFKTASILEGLPEEEQAMLMQHKTEQPYKKGEIIFREGHIPNGIFYMIEGRAKKYKLDRARNEQIIYVANAGELIGYHAILSEERYPDSAAALEESLIAFIPKDSFLATLEHSESLSRRLVKTLSHEFTVLTNSLSLFAQKPVRERLALQLVVLREKYKEGFLPGMPVTINMGREDLAGIVGTSRENVVRVLTEFKEESILETKGRKIIIHDVKKLIGIAGYP